MLRRFPHIAAASLAALALVLSACSGSTPTDQQPASQSSKASETTQNSTDPTGQKESDPAQNSTNPTEREPDPALDSKILTGEVAGVTLKKADTLPDLDNALQDTDAQIEPAGCLKTGITQIGAGAQAITKAGVESLVLSSDSAAPGKYKEYAQRCSSVSGTAAGSPFKQNLEMQQTPDVGGVADLVAVMNSSDTTVNGKALSTKAYLLIGSINGNTVIAQSLTLNGGEPSTETATELFKAQVEKLKG